MGWVCEVEIPQRMNQFKLYFYLTCTGNPVIFNQVWRQNIFHYNFFLFYEEKWELHSIPGVFVRLKWLK